MKYKPTIFVLILLGVSPCVPQIVHVWDLRQFDRLGQLSLYNPDEDAAEFGASVGSGELNDDGLDDLVVSAMAGDGPKNDRANAGKLYVFSGFLIEELRTGSRVLDLAEPWPAGVGVFYGPHMIAGWECG